MLVGYCPTNEEDDLIIVKNLLIPGMNGTPEHKLLDEHEFNTMERVRFDQRIVAMPGARDSALMMWFSMNGYHIILTEHKDGTYDPVELGFVDDGNTYRGREGLLNIDNAMQNAVETARRKQ